MKVYVVTAGEYSDYHICKIFLDKEKAEKYVAIENEINQYYDECWINEWETDDDNVDMTAKVGHYYYAYIDMGGELHTDEEDDGDEPIPKIDKGEVIIKADDWGISVYSKKSYKHAEKVAIEQYQKITQLKLELEL